MILFQEAAESPTANLLAEIQALGWVDKTAIGVLVVFFVLGLFKGLIWQVSRIAILVTAYFVAGRFGRQVAELLGGESPVAGAEVASQPAVDETTLYLAYCILFVAVLIVLSLIAMLVKKLADKAGLGFFDRLGGGVLGVATGACVVLFGVFVVHMFFPGSGLAMAAESSHSLRWSRKAIDWLGSAVDDDLRTVLALDPLDPRRPGPRARPDDDPSGDGQSGGSRGAPHDVPAPGADGNPTTSRDPVREGGGGSVGAGGGGRGGF